MGEYAKHGDREIKIGTCENMYYLRYDQRHEVSALPGNVDPVYDAERGIRFRFPFPDEDFVSPGGFIIYWRTLLIPGIVPPRDVEHRTGCDSPSVSIVQQKRVNGQTLLIAECSCGALYRYDTWGEAAKVVDACMDQAGDDSSWEEIAVRIAAGYKVSHD